MARRRQACHPRLLASVLILALLGSACGSSRVLPIGAAGQPFRPDSAEQALWITAEREEEALLRRTTTYDDPLLVEYLGNLADRLVPESVRVAGAPRVKVSVLRDPTLNAFAMPNGRLYLHTGLLSRLANEAQLATVLAHELAHFTSRHALRVRRAGGEPQTGDTSRTLAASIGMAVAAGTGTGGAGDDGTAAVFGPTANAVLGLGLTVATMAAINGYGPDLEREADGDAVERLVKAGYDPAEAPKAFTLLQSELAGRGGVEIFFHGRAARLQERIVATGLLAQRRYAAASDDPARVRTTEEFVLRMRPVVRENAYEDIRLGRFALASRQLDHVLEATPEDAMAHVYYGDLHRLQGQRAQSPGNRNLEAARALQRYERAIELDPTLPDPYRQLGLLHYQQKNPEKARLAFEKYLELEPDAPDGQRIREYLAELNR